MHLDHGLAGALGGAEAQVRLAFGDALGARHRSGGLHGAVAEIAQPGHDHERDGGDGRDHDGADGALALQLRLALLAQLLALGGAAVLG